MPLTIYEKELIRILRTRCGELTTGQTVEKLTALGVIDSTLCKVCLLYTSDAADE